MYAVAMGSNVPLDTGIPDQGSILLPPPVRLMMSKMKPYQQSREGQRGRQDNRADG